MGLDSGGLELILWGYSQSISRPVCTISQWSPPSHILSFPTGAYHQIPSQEQVASPTRQIEPVPAPSYKAERSWPSKSSHQWTARSSACGVVSWAGKAAWHSHTHCYRCHSRSHQSSASQRRTSYRSGIYDDVLVPVDCCLCLPAPADGIYRGIGSEYNLNLHLTRFGTNIRKGVQDMSQFFSRQVLGIVIATIDGLMRGWLAAYPCTMTISPSGRQTWIGKSTQTESNLPRVKRKQKKMAYPVDEISNVFHWHGCCRRGGTSEVIGILAKNSHKH